MSPIELFTKEGKATGVYFCEKCRIVNTVKDVVERCCAPWKCETCGGDTKKYWTTCDDCRAKKEAEAERARFEKAEKLTSWNGWVFKDGTGRDGYSQSLGDFMDCYAEEQENSDDPEPLPEYVWACKETRFVRADISDISSRIDDDAYEDFEFDSLRGIPELKAALEAFNAANIDAISYSPDYTKAVLIPKTNRP